MNSWRLTLHKIKNWEYWPMGVLYLPIVFVWIYYACKARSFFFFNAANPSIANGGFMMESKKEIYDLIPENYYPKTLLFKNGASFSRLRQHVLNELSFPVIAKPDIGLRGSAVKKINNESELQQYFLKADFDFLVQEYVPYGNEVGIFYVRYPGELHGRITGIVAKEFLSVEGDGQSTILELLKKDPRHAMQIKNLMREYGGRMFNILPHDEVLNLVPVGNHCRGAKFIDASHLATPALIKTIDDVCRQIEGFYFGRIDIMYQSIEELEKGRNFSIIEINGAASEPTHIYDPKHTIFFAWKEMARHIGLMYNAGARNRKKGHRYLSYREGMEQLKLHREHNRKIMSFIGNL
jgi:hypothetical protein